MKDQVIERDLTSPISNIKSLHITLGEQCNVRCTMCTQTTFSRKYNLTELILYDRLLPLYPHLSLMILQGGELTALEGARKFIQFIHKNFPDIKLATFTNGNLFNDFWADIFLKHGGSVRFSLNASSKDTHEKIVKYSNWEKVINNLMGLVKKREDTGAHKLEIGASFVVLKENYFELPDFVRLCSDLSLDSITIIPHCRAGYYFNNKDSFHSIETYMRTTVKLCKNLGLSSTYTKLIDRILQEQIPTYNSVFEQMETDNTRSSRLQMNAEVKQEAC